METDKYGRTFRRFAYPDRKEPTAGVFDLRSQKAREELINTRFRAETVRFMANQGLIQKVVVAHQPRLNALGKMAAPPPPPPTP